MNITQYLLIPGIRLSFILAEAPGLVFGRVLYFGDDAMKWGNAQGGRGEPRNENSRG
jgi:hypothetical protein